MLIVPEKKAILIFPPRTGSSTLHNAILQACPTSFMLYRHAERDCIPPGYESYQVFGFVRHPLARMWSLYKFLCGLDPLASATWAQEEVMRLLESVQHRTFEDWLLFNREPFLPADSGHPGLYQKHHMPETMKSQAWYLRPDLGTEIILFQRLPDWMETHGLPPLHLNASAHRPIPPVSDKVELHLVAHMGWELGLGLDLV